MNSSLNSKEMMDVWPHIQVLDEIDKFVNTLVKKEITDFNAKLDLLREAKKLYETFRDNMIWVLGKHERDEFYTHDYLEVLDKMKNETDNEDLKGIIEYQKRRLNEKIDDIRKKFSEIEEKMLKQLALTKITKSASTKKIISELEKIRANEKDTSKAYGEILKFGKELLNDISKDDIRKFADNNFRRPQEDPPSEDDSKDILALLLFHYILGKVKNDSFYLIEDALYIKKIPFKTI